MKKILLTALLFCLMPFLGFAQQPTQTDEALFGPGPRSRALPSHLQMNLRDGSDEIWFHAMFVSDPDHQYGYYYSIYENGDVVPVMMYNNFYFSAAEYYKPYPAIGDDDIFPVWGYAVDQSKGFHRLMYLEGIDNNTLSPTVRTMRDMTYDYFHDAPGREGRMLGMEYGKIYLINMDWNTQYAGEAELLYDPADHPEVGRPITLACNLDGELFFVTMSEDGITSSKLYKFLANDVLLENPIEVGDVNWPAQFVQTMAFDHRNDDRLYWWQCDKDNNTNLVEIDPETAETTLVAATGTTEMAGLVFEYEKRPHTVYCLDGEKGGILLMDTDGEYTAPQQDYFHKETVDFQVSSEDGYSVTRLTVVKHGTDKVLLTIEAAELEDGAGSFAMPAYDVDLVGEWAGNEHPITYEWTPEGVDGLDISGPETGNFKDYVTISYRIDAEGYVLTGLTAQSGDTDIRVRKLSPNEDGKRYFRMPDGEVTVTGTYQEITLGQLEDFCQHSPAQVPVYSIPEGVTDNGVQVKKPESSDWVAFADGDWTDGDNFDVAGTWQYRVEVANDYGTFHSPTLEFQVFDAPAIAIEGDSDYCEGSTLELNAVPTPDDAVLDGQLQWYKDGTPLSDATQPQLIIENVSADDAGDYTVTYTTGEGLCQFEAQAFAVNVHQLPEITWMQPSADTAVSLVTASLELQATPEGGTFYYLKQGDEERTEITSNTFTFPEAGEYELIYSYVDEYGCANEASLNAEVKQHHFIYYQENGNTNFPDNYTITGASEYTDGETTLLYAHQDDEVTVTVEVPDCSHLTGISIFAQYDDGSPFCILDWVNPSTNTFTITMPAQNSDGIPYYVTVNATWEPNNYQISYQWTPTGVDNLDITGPATGNCGSEVTVTFKVNITGYILTDLTAQSGETDIPMSTLSPNQSGKRKFTMPDGPVTVTGTYQAIEIDSLPPVCQYQAPGMPVFNITSDNYTSYHFGVKKPGSGWTTINDESYWENGNNFDVAGYWQYRVQITNGYGTFRSVAREFQVYEAPQSIAIDGETTLCQGGNLALTVVPTPDDAVMNGQFHWYKDGTLLPNYTQPSLAINNVTADAAGSYSATFLVGDDLCQFETEAVTVSVNQLPEITWVTPSNDTNDTIVLSVMTEALQLEATPAGGAFTYTTADAPETPITIEGGLLNPSEMGIGTYKLTYSYTDAETNCSAEASIDVKIKKIYWTDIEIRDNDWFINCINNGFRYEITNARELGAFAALLNYYNLASKDQEGIEFYDFAWDTVWIANDIDLLEEPYYFRPLNEFCGTLNGLGHVIDNMVIDEKNLIMVFNKYSRIENIGFLNSKITNKSETKAAIDIKGTMYNSYFTNPELNNITFNYYPEGDVQNVYYYNGRDEEVVSKYFGYVENIEIDNHDDVTEALPATPYWNYSLSQQIYQMSQRDAQPAKINALQFHSVYDEHTGIVSKNWDPDVTRNWEIYLTTTDQAYYESESSYIVPNRNTKVFDGPVTVKQDGWYTVQLDTPFNYDGSNNLLLTVYDKTGQYVGPVYSAVTVTENEQALYYYQDSDPIDISAPSAQQHGSVKCVDDIRFVYSTTIDATPEELLSGEGQDEATGYLADWVWSKNTSNFFSWVQDPVGDSTSNYGYPVMDTAYTHHHLVHTYFDNGEYELGGRIMNRLVDGTEHFFAKHGDTVTFALNPYPYTIIDTVWVEAMNYDVIGDYQPIDYIVEDGVYTFVMPDDGSLDKPYEVSIYIDSYKDYWIFEPNYDTTWLENGPNSLGIWEIHSNEQLAAFASAIYHGYRFEEQSVQIVDAVGPGDNAEEGKLNMAAHLWHPIDGFGGVLDGKGFILDNLAVREESSYVFGYMRDYAIICNLGIQDLMIPDSSYVFLNGPNNGYVLNSFITKNPLTDNSEYFIAPDSANVENTYIVNPGMVDYEGNAIDIAGLNAWVDDNQNEDIFLFNWRSDVGEINYTYPIHHVPEHDIIYQWTPENVTELAISGPSTGKVSFPVAIHYPTSVEGYCLMKLKVESGDVFPDMVIDSDNQSAVFTMPNSTTWVRGTYKAIVIDSLPDICQYQSPGAPLVNFNADECVYKLKKPNQTDWSDFHLDNMEDGNNFDVAGIWQYRVEITNEYGTFTSSTRTFQVYEAPEITWVYPTDGESINLCDVLYLQATPSGGTFSQGDYYSGNSETINGNTIDYSLMDSCPFTSLQLNYSYETESGCTNVSSITINTFMSGCCKNIADLQWNRGQADIEVTLYPNPTRDEVNILCNDFKIEHVTVLDMLGQVILDNEVNSNETVLHLKDAAPGMYLVRVATAQGFVMKKLMVE